MDYRRRKAEDIDGRECKHRDSKGSPSRRSGEETRGYRDRSSDRRRETKDSYYKDRHYSDKRNYDNAKRDEREETKKYGLINARHGREDSSDKVNKSYLGPNPDLIKRKSEAENRALDEKRNKQKVDVKALSEEEKARRLREMEANADTNDHARHARHSSTDSSRARHYDNIEEGMTGNAKFLQLMRTEVYQQAADGGIKSRLEQHKHYQQRSVDLNSEGNFLKMTA